LVGDSLYANGANHTLHYITLPVMVKYAIGKKKLTFRPGIGIGLNIVTKATLTTDLTDNLNRETESLSKLDGIKKLSTSLIINPELQYSLSKKWNLSVSPYFKYSLGAINKGNVVKTYPYTIGVGLGVVYKF
jgi:outer membrane protein W